MQSKANKAPWEAPNFIPDDTVIDHQKNQEEHEIKAELDMALPDVEPAEFSVSTTVSSTIKPYSVTINQVTRTLFLNLPLMLRPLKEILS